jgi:hypothetical protein
MATCYPEDLEYEVMKERMKHESPLQCRRLKAIPCPSLAFGGLNISQSFR